MTLQIATSTAGVLPAAAGAARPKTVTLFSDYWLRGLKCAFRCT